MGYRVAEGIDSWDGGGEWNDELDFLVAKCGGVSKYWLWNNGLKEVVSDIQKDNDLNSSP